MSGQEIYMRFIDWLRRNWWDLPEADELVPLIMSTYTPEEASLLTGMPFSEISLEELAAIKRMEVAELSRWLDALAKRGLVFRSVKGDTVRYSLNEARFVFVRSSFWPGHTDQRSKAMAPLVNRYYYHGLWDHMKYVHAKGLRVLPAEGTIEHTHQILPYEEAAKLLDTVDYFAVSTCPCRHRKNIDPDSPNCKYPTEVCLHFDWLGRYTVENDMGHELTREEAHDILRQCAEAGLVHGVSNYQDGVDTLCNCCRCCCLFFEGFHKLKHDMSLSPSNYRVCTNPEICIGCGLCVKRCPMGAMRLEDRPEAKNRITMVAARNKRGKAELKNKMGRVAVNDPGLCIGCGVCAYKCSTQSLVLERQEVIKDPPKDRRDHAKVRNAELEAARARLGQSQAQSL